MKNQLFAKKPISLFESDMQKSGLNRVLGKWALAALGVGAIIGAGIFVMTGLAAKEYAGPALSLSFVIAGLGCIFAALCYAEFASLIPVEGSAYAYSYATVGELFAWIIGWDLILEYAMGAATVAVGWSGYLAKLLGLVNIHFPLWLMNDPTTAHHAIKNATASGNLETLHTHYSSLDIPNILGFNFAINLPAFLIVLAITAILVIGIRQASSMNKVMVFIKLAAVLFVIIVGFFYVDVANWHPFIPVRAPNSAGVMSYGWIGIISGAAYVFFAYIGFDAVSTQAGESINPRKDVPFGIIISLLVCTTLYILVSLVLTGMVKYTSIDITAPVAAAFGAKGMNFAVWIISIAAVAGLTSVLLVMMLGQSRVLFAMAKDGLLPKSIFASVHSKFKTPYKSTIITGFVVAIVASFTPIDMIAKLVNIGTLLAFVMVCIAVWRMRYTNPQMHRSFKVPFLPAIALLGIIFNLGMMLSLEIENWMRLFIWLGAGLLIYFFYSRKNSVMANHQ